MGKCAEEGKICIGTHYLPLVRGCEGERERWGGGDCKEWSERLEEMRTAEEEEVEGRRERKRRIW